MSTDLTLTSARADRDALADRTDVLDKVGVLRTLPDSLPMYHGCIYVIAFDDGSLKVGKTRRPKARLSTHFNKAHEHGVAVLDLWVSDPHIEYADNENLLIDDLRARAEVRVRETFTGTGFSEAARFASALPHTCLSDAEIADRQRRETAWTRDEAKTWLSKVLIPPSGGELGRRLTAAEIDAALVGGVIA